MPYRMLGLVSLAFVLALSRPAPAQQGIVLGPSGVNPDSRTAIENPLLPLDDGEKQILETLQQARRGLRYANVSETDGRLLRLLTETTGAKLVVEIGTSTGESGLWFAMALRKTGGKLITHEIHPGRAKTAEENFGRAGVDHLITDRLGGRSRDGSSH
jgi:caffeoyl-CoA O-methyltransferase